MATNSRPRAITALVAVLLAVAPALSATPAHAGDVERVEFVGGSLFGALVCRARPSVERLTVPPDTLVVFVNRLGGPARLRVDGREVATVDAGRAVPVVFRGGARTVSMVLPCRAGVVERFGATSVTVHRADHVPGGPTAGGAGMAGSGSSTGADGATGGYPMDGFEVGSSVAVSEPPRGGTSGLLALLACVCVAGVTLAAIRAIVAQRTSQTHLA